jgi:CTP:molybdopterin cytidylyltransferase MocA
MVLLGDMPYVSADSIDRLIRAFERRPGFVIATVGGVPSHPRIIPGGRFDEFLAMDDGAKGQGVIEAAGFTAVEVPVASGRDIDRPGDIP